MVDLPAVFPKAEADVWAGSKSCRPYVADHLPLLDMRAWADAFGEFLHVQVLRLVGIVVLDLYEVAVALSVGGAGHHTVAHRVNGRAVRCCVIRAVVRAAAFQDRVVAVEVVVGRNAGVL